MRDVTHNKMLERMKDEFLSVVSHELRTPLSAIMGYSDLMLRGVHGGLNDRQARALKAVRANASRLLHLINDLLDASKLESGAMPVTLESHNIGEVVQRTITQTRVLAVEAGLDLVSKVTPERNLRVLADEPKLQQVFENLLANAIKFTPAGGTIVFDADYSELDPGAPELLDANTRAITDEPGKARSLVVSVSDTGAGIDQEQIERIWDRFYQVDASAKRRSGGAGLGLAIVRGLLSLHGGQVWVESPGANEGSTFRFSLALAPGVSANEAASEQVSAADSAPSPSNGALLEGNLVLVAEDDADQREIICDMLELEGYNVVLAADGAEAIELADRLQPSAIALDVILPRNDGWEVLNHLKQNPRTMDIPVLIISVVDQQEFGRKLGADAYLLKPIEPMALRETVRRMLQGRNGVETQSTGEA
jgi:CheY-like chemotaxis protein/nitrogen-specific signal transduction histidine kinase